MKLLQKFLVLTLVMTCLLVGKSFAASASNNLYTVAISTFGIDDAAKGADIAQASVLIKAIDITNTTATAQTITVYELANDTNTINAVYTFAVPAAIGTYSMPLINGIGTSWSSKADYISISYPGVRTSVSSSAATANFKYWE